MDWSETPAELARARAERPVLIPGSNGVLRGIFTPPAREAPPAELCVVMPGRMRWLPVRGQVKTARALAACGFACLRFDYHGYGESEGVAEKIFRETPFSGDVVDAIRYLRRAHGQRAFVLWGRCFDSLSSLAAFAHEADAIAGLLFVAAPMLELSENSGIGSPGFSMHAGAAAPPIAQSFARHFAALVRSRARALFLYGERDQLYQELQVARARLFAKLDREARERIQVEVWPGHIHLPDTIQREHEVLARMQSWVETLHPQFARSADGPSPGHSSRQIAPYARRAPRGASA